ncbi:uncharacterized protein SCHCODRAFT_02521017 [Schizophyllum commune H4-8]|nr:uncharacterized protein SCHCODRAFT_02521017 [Schizophyllum commune H4-8]KAI5884999.1 hypothetical protein SCHCODRAFT_02521017 [Schizophyllum commune H4-8]
MSSSSILKSFVVVRYIDVQIAANAMNFRSFEERNDIGQCEGIEDVYTSNRQDKGQSSRPANLVAPSPSSILSSVCDWYKYWGTDLQKGLSEKRCSWRNLHSDALRVPSFPPSTLRPCLTLSSTTCHLPSTIRTDFSLRQQPLVAPTPKRIDDASDDALKPYKKHIAESEKENALLERNVKQERFSASAQATAACKEASSLRKDLSAARAELAEVKEHAVGLTEIHDGRCSARDWRGGSSRACPKDIQEPCDDKLVERDAPLVDEAVLQAFVTGLWDTLGRVAQPRAQKEAAWARSEVEDLRRVPSTSNSSRVAQLPTRMPLQSTDLLRAMSGGSPEVGSAMKRKSEEMEVLVEKYNTAKEDNARLTWTHDQLANEERMTISRALSCDLEPAENVVSTSSAIGGNELDASQSMTLTFGDVDAPSTFATAMPSPAKVVDAFSARNSAIATILGGAHRSDDMLPVTFACTKMQYLSGDVKALRAALDVACIPRIGGDAPLRTALHDVASTRADSHAAREGAKVWKRKYAKRSATSGKRTRRSGGRRSSRRICCELS